MDMIAADFTIRQLHARFADAAWRQDAEEFAGCFASQGRWSIAGHDFSGREAIEQACVQLLGRCEHVHLITGQPILRAEDEAIAGRVTMTEFAWMPDGTQFFTVGTYHDRYVEAAGEWTFAERSWTLKYRGPIDLSGPLSGQGSLARFHTAG